MILKDELNDECIGRKDKGEDGKKKEKNYYLVKSDVLGYAKRKGLINGRSKRQISERGHIKTSTT